jgi:predicted 3-demethylubiquinone-9 3-methyltransferase (glyoxalase superfamily)
MITAKFVLLKACIHLKKTSMSKQKITPYLWFNNNLEEAMDFYKTIFKNASFTILSRWGEGSMAPKGSVMSASFELEGQQFMALNGGPMFQFTEAISFFINCDTQEEVDIYWDKLSEGGAKSRCGWLKDKFGLSWQVIPTALGKLMQQPDPAASQRVMQAMMKMDKIIIADLEKAAAE